MQPELLNTKPSQTWQEDVLNLCQGLYYPSESDEPIQFIALDYPFDCFDAQEFINHRQMDSPTHEALSFEEFFMPVAIEKDWYNTEEREVVAQFIRLAQTLSENLTNIVGIKIGDVEKQVFLIGKTKELGQWAGVQTRVVET